MLCGTCSTPGVTWVGLVSPDSSQADGIDPLPQPAALGELPSQARVYLWDIIYESLKESTSLWGSRSIITEPWETILHDYHTFLLHQPTDEFSIDFEGHANEIKPLFLKGDYNRVFDFLQCVLRHESAPPESLPAVSSVLRGCMCAYTVVEDGPTIVPIAMPEQIESMQEAFQVLQSGPFAAARSHLRKSAECINKGDLAGSIRESITAVESVARRLDPNAAKTLKPALDALSKRNVALHPAFKKGIKKFYAYTSDEKGIRHALLEEQANVDRDDAVFMFRACTSFAAYLVNKARKAGLFEP